MIGNGGPASASESMGYFKYWSNVQTLSETKFCLCLEKNGYNFLLRIPEKKGVPGNPIDSNAEAGPAFPV